MIALQETTGGIILPVKAQPGAKRNGIIGEHDGSLKVAVRQIPERGKANDAIAAVLADSLDLQRGQIELHSGQASSQKKFLLTGISLGELKQKIARFLPDDSVTT